MKALAVKGQRLCTFERLHCAFRVSLHQVHICKNLGDVRGVVNALGPNTLRAWRQSYIVLSSETAMRSFTRVTACSRFPDTNKRIACGKRIRPASKLKQTADRTFISKRNLISSAPQSRKQTSKVSNAKLLFTLANKGDCL